MISLVLARMMILETLFVHQCTCQGMFNKIMLMTFTKWRRALRKTSKILLMRLPCLNVTTTTIGDRESIGN